MTIVEGMLVASNWMRLVLEPIGPEVLRVTMPVVAISAVALLGLDATPANAHAAACIV